MAEVQEAGSGAAIGRGAGQGSRHSLKRNLRAFLGAGLTLLLGVLLICTIYFTIFDLQWIAFLGGVLFAAVAATASQVSKAQWLVMRRNRQLQRLREQLAQESAVHRSTAEALKGAESRMRLVLDAMPEMIVYVTRDFRCHDPNRAFAHWVERGPEQIDGLDFREVVGDEVFEDIKVRGEGLGGTPVRFAAAWRWHGDGSNRYAVTLVPDLDKGDQAIGYYVLITLVKRPPAAVATAPAKVPAAVVQESAAPPYGEPIAAQPIGGPDPRAHLVRALQEDQFLLFAQRIKPLAADAPDPRCFEVLLRLQEEEDYMAPPGGFFPVAERYNLMTHIDRWVVQKLLASCRARSQADPAWIMPLYCVNIATASLNDADFAAYVRDQLDRHKYSAANLCFEIAELDAVNHHPQVKAFMTSLKPTGCRFTLDSFGSVKASVGPLKELPLDFLKIDGMIIANMLNEPSDLAKVKAIVKIAQNIGMRTIAELVESDETIAKLRELGVDYAQGFGIDKPGPIAQMS